MKSVRLVIEMVNQHGLDEAGIDGGGVLREFINLLIETSFDPTRGFFVLTSDGFLYPNPNVAFIVEEYEAHCRRILFYILIHKHLLNFNSCVRFFFGKNFG